MTSFLYHHRAQAGGKRTFLPLIFLLCSFQTFSQQLFFKHLSAAEGLSSEIINSMTEDRFGRIWMATENGVNVFDGYEVKAFNRSENSGLLSDYISVVGCDSAGRIWIGSEGGINYLEENNSRFARPAVENGIQITSCNTIRTTSTYGTVFSTPQGYFFFNEKSRQLQRIGWLSDLIPPEPLRVKVKAGINDDQHVFILPDKFVVIDLAARKVIYTHKDRNVRAVQPCDGDELMVIKFNTTGLYRIRIPSGEVIRFEDSTDSRQRKISAIFSDIISCGDGKLALASRYSGLYFYDCNTGRFLNYRHDPSSILSINSNYCRNLYYSKKGFLFVATTPLSYCNLRELPFKSVRFLRNDEGVINDDVVNCFAEDTLGNIWIGTNSALVKWNPATDRSRFYYYITPQPTVVYMNTIRGVTIDHQQRVWVSTYGGGVGRLDEEKGIFKKLTRNQDEKNYSFPSTDGSSIECDRYGYLWVSTPAGICKIDPRNLKVEKFLTHPNMKSVAGVLTFNHFFDSHENLWLGTRKGAWCFNRNLDSIAHLQWADKDRGNDVYSFAEDNVGNIYIGTGNGLHIVHLQSGRKTTLNKEQGLPSNRILGLLTDDEGNVWFSAAKGLGKIIAGSMQIETYDSRYGVLMSDHKEESYYKTKNGIMFMGCRDGFNYFDPRDVKPSEYDFQTYIMDISYGDSIVPVGMRSAFKLTYSENTISFRYLTIDYQFAPIIQYQYQLQGLDTTWIPAGNQREVRYANLQHGKYTFLVRASTDGKNWTLSKNSVPVHIVAPIWMRWWFIAIVVAVTAGLVVYFVRQRIRSIRHKAAIQKDFEKKIAAVRMNMLRAQMNPHFIFNSLNSINNFILKNDPKNASGYLTKFSRLMRMILDNSRSEWVTLESELNAIELYVQLEALRFDNGFEYKYHVDPGVNPAEVVIPPLIVQPYVENAIWHGLLYRDQPGGVMQLNIWKNNGRLNIEVNDNGVGRKAAAEWKSKSAVKGKSHGMKITDERLSIVNTTFNINASVVVTDLYDSAGQANGTNVIIELDYIQNSN